MPLDGRYTARQTSPRRVKFLGIGERQVRVVASDGSTDRMGDVLVPSGVKLENYRRNPVILAQHDSSQPIATCASVDTDGVQVTATIEFPPEGINDLADEYLRLLKSRVLNAVSVGFLPLAAEPIRGTNGLRYTSWELLEISVVSIPANANALVQERSLARKRVTDLAAHRVARDLARAAAIEARHPRSREEMLARAAQLRARYGRPEPVTPAEAYAADEELRRRDRAAAGDYILRLGGMW
jgi:HK97 family phage prohead protease